MKLFLLKICAFLVAFSALLMLLYYLFPTRLEADNYLFAYNDKLSRLEQTDTPRVILVGGSNIAFGVSSEMIEDSLHCNVVNMGLHAGLGVRYTLRDYLRFIRPGDIVVFQIEYSAFSSGGEISLDLADGLLAVVGRENIRKYTLPQLCRLAKIIPNRVMKNIPKALLDRNADESSPNDSVYHYRRSGFNKWGDEASHWTLKTPSPGNINVQLGKKRSAPRALKKSFVDWLAAEACAYEAAGAKVIFLPPVVCRSLFPLFYKQGIKECLAVAGRPYIVAPEDMVVDDSCSFDAEYHVNYAGVRQNTQRIIRILRREISDSIPVRS
ncbi:MAG: hypothetical protein IJ722_02265 [Alloprevotella sp.]|nr:hypothetical protein [Alloprevotella sp.]